ncbi:poly polymerase and DNA-ligase Zn-finger region family protein (macronuclear) [Tetrahymena thermophila SB210]|uniref:Poly polymerase and DNA-ligase Zn-finger region family protein n=1 Tax=Tetrahymena thermophila (strain SB210) TaxID=312017 RepID=Q23M88_TETTS|nr:poly polymerase and DNA-ligase Zn-finger region family protein [Tetrahymena thermophila SB210]EAR97625.1 poly polymerase and DNA-ligase Zn-finger region family protein [Tetrahymena thermophila SB210]|eukprot:XP_001017870.1 poly polymerase and DNA-ligase Zn-finger region family protein [Tetrahymena thermophila SB210]
MVQLSIEKAKSARSSCKQCKQKIAKDEVRVGISISKGDYDETSWYHVSCFSKTKFAGSKDIEDLDGYSALSGTEQAEAKKNFDKGAKAAKGKAKGKKGSKSESDEPESGDESDEDSGKGKNGAKKGAAKKGSSGGALAGYTAAEKAKYEKYYEEALKLSVAAIKQALKKNGMTQNGNKQEIASRMADCQTMGTLPNCSKCGGGRLRFNQQDGTYFCKGYMDDADFVNCSAKYPKSEITRGTWTD